MGMPHRRPQQRNASANTFNKRHGRRHVFNIKIMRGGWRL